MSKNKIETIISYINKEMIVENTIISNKQSYFTIYDRKSKEIHTKNIIEINGKQYKPIDINSSFIKSESILFPSGISNYGTKKELLKSINDYIVKYIDIPQDYRIITTYYILLTYIYDNFSEIPYLRVIGDYGSGKSRFLKTIGSICYIPMLTNGGTSLSAIFRMIDRFKGTLVLDEADFNFSDTTSDMIKLLNNGYQKGCPIMRADGEGFDVTCYSVFGPKIIGGRIEFKDKATESRCLSNIMKRSKRINIPIGLDKSFYEESLELRNKLLKFRFDHYNNIELKNKLIQGIEPRLNQIINPILSIVDNEEIEKVIINNLNFKQQDIKEDRKNSIFGAILSIIKIRSKNSNEIYYKDILDDLEIVEGRHNFTNRKLGSLLKQNSLKTKRKNNGTIIEVDINKEELERLYFEYSID